MDRGYANFSLYNQIVHRHRRYVGRLRDNSAHEVVKERPLSAADVLRDQYVRFSSGPPAPTTP